MDVLNEDCMLIILNNLTLDERTVLRLVSKKIQNLCDSINIRTLVVYERSKPLPGKLAFSNERFGIEDCVYVFDLNKFFNNQLILKRMANIRTLVIYGYEKSLVNLNVTFDQLNHLELYNIHFTNSNIIKSTQIQCLSLSFAFMKTQAEMRAKTDEIRSHLEHRDSSDVCLCSASISMFCHGFDELKSLNIKYLSIGCLTDCNFFYLCVQNHLFDSVEHLDIKLKHDLSVLIFLSDCLPKLKRIDCLVNKDLNSFLKSLDDFNLKEVTNRLRDDLDVYLFACLFNKRTVHSIRKLLEQLAVLVDFDENQVCTLYLSRTCIDLFKSLQKKHEMNEFYKLIRKLSVDDKFKSAHFFKKLVNCNALFFGFHSNSSICLAKFLKALPKTEVIFLSSDYHVKFGTDAEELLIARADRIKKFLWENWNGTDFSFLLKLHRLEELSLFLFNPIDQELFIQLIDKLRYLNLIEICFAQSTNLSKEQLSAFKKLVNERFADKFQVKKLIFKIELHKKHGYQFVRYVLKKTDETCGIDELMKDRVFYSIKYRQKMMLRFDIKI